ncbi:MAG TPA: tRNA (adenosine(37)-N6)-threonylcarbamoyltransferase complex dimerization subunit type 1 TsaB [Chromatiales bacterium]|nr:tRNA (adenosine(37)-N6)-threonylcarbamoyltransferase complex dimerization subunit type 1 TsaB [Chromatiales bacterium]
MKVLAIETATESCSASLYIDGETREQFAFAPREHSNLILEMMQALLAEAEIRVAALDVLAFGRGPGSFTGVRIAAGVAQGTAFAAGLPVAPVSTLAALAQGCVRETGGERVAAAIDARMNEVYWGTYVADTRGCVVPVRPEEVVPAQNITIPDGRGWVGVGSGWAAYGAVLKARLGDALTKPAQADRLPRAHDVAFLAAHMAARGELVAPEEAVPVYLRDDVAKKASANI